MQGCKQTNPLALSTEHTVTQVGSAQAEVMQMFSVMKPWLYGTTIFKENLISDHFLLSHLMWRVIFLIKILISCFYLVSKNNSSWFFGFVFPLPKSRKPKLFKIQFSTSRYWVLPVKKKFLWSLRNFKARPCDVISVKAVTKHIN